MVKVVFHKNCPDGEAGLWVFKKKFKCDIDDIYGQEPGCENLDLSSLLEEKNRIYFIDICPSEEILSLLLKNGNDIVILDHHKTNKQTVEKFTKEKNLFAEFDMNRSGCQIAWDYFFPEEPERPEFLDYIADRDLWHWKLKNSQEINGGIQFYGLDKFDEYFNHWDEWKPMLIEMGTIIEQKSLDKISNIIEKKTFEKLFKNDPDTKVLLTFNTDYTLTSKLGNLMCECDDIIKFAVIVTGIDFDKKKYSLSLRSKNFDVSEVAKIYGGGGHHCASGCVMDFDTFNTTFV